MKHGIDITYIRNRIHNLRKQKGLSENQMSIELGHCRTYIYNIVSGRAKPSLEQLLSICDYFEISPEDFFRTKSKNLILEKEIAGKIQRLKNDKSMKAVSAILDALIINEEEFLAK